MFIDERQDSINDGWLAVNLGSYDPQRSSGYVIVDDPASYHNRAGGLAFADGHSEIRKWQDARTTPILKFGQPRLWARHHRIMRMSTGCRSVRPSKKTIPPGSERL